MLIPILLSDYHYNWDYNSQKKPIAINSWNMDGTHDDKFLLALVIFQFTMLNAFCFLT